MGVQVVIDRIFAMADVEWEAEQRRRARRREVGKKSNGGQVSPLRSAQGRHGKGWWGGKKKMPPKRVGEMGELRFLQKAMGMGFLVSKPWGDSDRYDFVADWEGLLWRVQVRSTEHLQGPRGYAVHASVYVGREIVGLTKKDIDVLVAYIFPKDLWYVVPVEKFVPRKNLWFYPDGSKKGAKFEEFREAWGLMRGERAKKRKR